MIPQYMLTLPKLIEVSGVKLAKYKIHCATGKSPNSPLDAFYDGTFQTWQDHQNQLNFKCDQIIGLIQLTPGKWLFAGLYDVLGVREGQKTRSEGYTYRTKQVCGLEHLDGRAIIAFPKLFRASYLKGSTYAEQLIVDAIRQTRMTIGDFPGFNEVLLSFSKLRTIVREQNPSWIAALGNVSGIYLIVDNKTGKQYVGSAYGGIGIWQRWVNYTTTKHGGNKELKSLLHQCGDGYEMNFQFSLLEVCDFYSSNDIIWQRETHWKRVLRSREFGLNAN